ncbi:hypothetical protein NIES267_38800 [Calothrix parasitica NIES-267]|uniref:Uncharacterized protein n=1 Tax=Calothrix parasitica NIES-267 TaxID=1973488 RepID=A0A1Z4LT62_9CYAN|nr:hypothetical protein NIES267_38800 [Calothrix parasitica NIES-267]
MKTKQYLSPKDYYWYIKSDAWRSKHYYWLKQSSNRCSMFPWVRIGKYARNKYGKYNIHHTGVGYKHLGYEELGRDVLPLCLFAHWLIHGGHMKAKAPWQPNIIQKTLHLWCSFPLILKQLLLLFSSLLIVFYFFILMRTIN